MINDLNGRHICTFIKRKIRMRAGQTDQAVTARDDRLETIGQLIGEKLGHVGNLDCDAFVTEEGCYIIDINPRIGGGYPFAHIAGANLPAALIACASGQEAEPAWFSIEPNVASSRFDGFIVTNANPTQITHPTGEKPLPRIHPKSMSITKKPNFSHQVAIIGAAPYGLATAAHLRTAKIETRVFG